MVQLDPRDVRGIVACVVVAAAIATCAMITALMPPEVAPRVDMLPASGQSYVLQSLKDAVRSPILTFFFVVYSALAIFVMTRQKPTLPPKDPASSGLPQHSHSHWFTRIFVWSTGALVGLLLLRAVLSAIWLSPRSTVRVIELDRRVVKFHSLLSTKSYSRSQVVGVDIERQDDYRSQEQTSKIQLIVTLADGQSLRSAKPDYRSRDPQLIRDIALLRSVKNDLLRE
jgi:hypothetical protein